MKFFRITVFSICSLMLITWQSNAQYRISTVAGIDPVSVKATATSLNNPYNTVLDAQGNIYIADQSNHRIRKVDAKTGLMTTFAGNGSVGFSGDGAAATNAQLNSPSGLTIHSNGDFYIADSGNNRVRKIDAKTGIITTFAGNGSSTFAGDGGQASQASLRFPISLVFDNTGNLFIGDLSNHRIRKIDKQTNIISTVVGSGRGYSGDNGPATSAVLDTPAGFAMDANGNIYIADSHNNRIRKVDATTQVITTIAGDGVADISGDGFQAINARLNRPNSVALDANGNIYIADRGNNKIRKITVSTGVISTVAGLGLDTFSGDGGPAVNAQLNAPTGLTITNGNIYVADLSNHRVRKIDLNTGIITSIAGNGTASFNSGYSGDNGLAVNAQINNPTDVALDKQGNVYIADVFNHCIRKITASTGIITTIAGNGTPGFSGDGGQAVQATLNAPQGIEIDAQGNIYVADTRNHRIRKIDATTKIINTIAGSSNLPAFSGDGGLAINAELANPLGIAFDKNGNIYIVDRQSHRIRKITISTGIITTVAGNGIIKFAGDGGLATKASLKFPSDVTVDPQGNLFIGDQISHRVRKVDAKTSIITTVDSDLYRPTGVASDTEGNVYIADRENYRIRKLDVKNNTITTIAGGRRGFSGDGGSALIAGMNKPYGITVNSDASIIYIATAPGHRIRKLTLTPEIDLKQATNPLANGSNQSFGNTLIDAQKSLSFTIENKGRVPLSLDQITVDGDFSLAGTLAKSLAAGEKLSLSITMNTTQAGDKTGTFTIQNNDLDEGNYVIKLTGSVAKNNQAIIFDLGTQATKKEGDPAFILKATASSGLPVTYTSSNTSVATISDSTVNIVGSGSTIITASQDGNVNYNAAVAVLQTLKVEKQVATGLASDFAHATLTLYPNPTSQILRIQLKGKVSKRALGITISDYQGRIVLQLEKLLQNGQLEIPVSTLVAGQYLINIKMGDESVVRHMIKQ